MSYNPDIHQRRSIREKFAALTEPRTNRPGTNMTTETFFANFGHLADAPKGVQKLRELILQLAVQGKLVPQDPSDEPASVLLEKIFGRKEQLIKEGKLRMTKVPIAFDYNEQTELPPTWVYSTLYDIGGIAPRNDSEDGAEASFVPMAQVSEFYGIPAQSETRAWGEIKSGFTHFAEGDVCLAKITPCYQNGKSAVMRGLRNGIGAGTTELHVFRAIDELVSPDYVLIFLKSPLFINEGIPRMTGSAGQKRITRDYFAGKPFPLPPLEEQKRIVAKVDQLMALCNELEARQQKKQQGRVRLNNSALDALLTAREPDEFADHWQRFSTNFDLFYDHPETIAKLRAAILQLAVQGRLVPKQQPDKWRAGLLGDVVDRSEAGWSPQCHSWPQSGDEWGVLKVSAVSWGRFNPAENKALPLELEARVRWSVQAGDFLISRANTAELVARSVVVDGDYPHLLMSDKIIRLIFKQNNDPKFFCLINNSRLAREYYARVAGGTSSTMKNVSRKQILELPVNIPPLEEQKRIVAKVDQLMVLCDELEAKLNQAQQHSEKLMEASVRQLLGTSTPQNPHTARAPAAPAAGKSVRPARHAYQPAPAIAEPIAAETAVVYGGSVPETILAAMQPGQEYSRAAVLAATSIREADWMWAIKQLKEQRRVAQSGEKRGARYRLK
jgi:type I restriction enzyme S subunit